MSAHKLDGNGAMVTTARTPWASLIDTAGHLPTIRLGTFNNRKLGVRRAGTRVGIGLDGLVGHFHTGRNLGDQANAAGFGPPRFERVHRVSIIFAQAGRVKDLARGVVRSRVDDGDVRVRSMNGSGRRRKEESQGGAGNRGLSSVEK